MRNRVARILVVEDEQDVRETIKLQLEDEGHEVTETDSGKKALVLAESSPFDLVLTDVMLPDLNGIELVQQMNQWPSRPVQHRNRPVQKSSSRYCSYWLPLHFFP